jgi:hypothetical protein
MIKIFLDDYRNPIDCLSYMYKVIGSLNPIYNQGEWFIVRNYPEFIKAIDRFKGEISHISYDHDLADGHYHQNMQEGVINYESEDFNSDDFNKTGYHAAQYFKKVYDEEKLEYPVMFVHSMNPVGTKNIINLFKEKND